MIGPRSNSRGSVKEMLGPTSFVVASSLVVSIIVFHYLEVSKLPVTLFSFITMLVGGGIVVGMLMRASHYNVGLHSASP